MSGLRKSREVNAVTEVPHTLCSLGYLLRLYVGTLPSLWRFGDNLKYCLFGFEECCCHEYAEMQRVLVASSLYPRMPFSGTFFLSLWDAMCIYLTSF